MLAVAAVGVSCQRAADSKAGVTVSGERHVRSPGRTVVLDFAAGTTPEWQAQSRPFVWIGVSDGDPDYVLDHVSGLVISSDGSIVVGDGGSRTVRAYSHAGKLLWAVGGEGDGPGEFRMLTSLHPFAGDSTLAFDLILRRLTVFDAAGKAARVIRLQPGSVSPDFVGGWVRGGGIVVVGLTRELPPTSAGLFRDTLVVALYDDGGSEVDRLATVPGFLRYQSSSGITLTFPFTPVPIIRTSDGAILVADGQTPEVTTVYPESAVQRVLRWQGRHGSTAEHWSVLGKARSLATAEARRVLAEVPRDRSIPEVAGLFVDMVGRYWIRRYDPESDARPLVGDAAGAGGRWWIVAPESGVLGHVQLPHGFRPWAADHNRVWGVSTDTLGVERVVGYMYDGD